MRKWGGTVRQSTWPVALACAAGLLIAGCGSGKSSATTGTTKTGAATTATGTLGAHKEGLVRDGKINYASPPANAPVQSGLVQISYHEFAIEPDTLKVKVGSTIRWTNNDPDEHNVTSEGGPIKFASKNFGEGGTFEIKATEPGVIHYENTLQPATMNGTIEVVK